MNQYTSQITINGERYEIHALSIDEFLEASQSMILKALTKAPFEITPQNIEALSPDVVFGLIASIFSLTSTRLSREIAELQKLKGVK